MMPNAAYEPTSSVTTIPSDAGSLASPSGGYTTTASLWWGSSVRNDLVFADDPLVGSFMAVRLGN